MILLSRGIAYLAVLFFWVFIMSAQANASTVYKIDFGSSSYKTTDTGWNNVTSEEGTDIVQLVDTSGNSTSLTIRSDREAWPYSTAGTQSSSIYPSNAARDTIYITSTGLNTSPTGYTFTIGGLNPSATYDIRIYASRTGVSDVRTADFVANGSVPISHDASNNVDDFDVLEDISPDGSDEIVVEMSLGTGNTSSDDFGYLGVMEIIENTPGVINLDPDADAGDDRSITLPTSSLVLSGLDSGDSDGEIVGYLWEEVTDTDAYIVSPTSATTTISDLLPGTTTFRLTVTDDLGGTDTDLVDVVLNNSDSTTPAKTIVVLGSSTAEGTGASSPDEAWVAQFADYVAELNGTSVVHNLGSGGTTTEDILPVAEGGRSGTNIEEAISLGADGIIINMPSNDTATGMLPSESIDNYDRIIELAAEQEIVVWITTTQPRTLSAADSLELIELRDLTISNYPHNHIDFWTRLAQGEDNARINPEYDAGDGIHLNDAGHEILYRRVIGSGFIESLYAPDPSFIDIDVDVSDNGVDVSWETDVIGSTIFRYGTSMALGTALPETNDHVRVTDHAVSISGLSSCTEYYYELASNGAYFNDATSTIRSFTTTGCPEPVVETQEDPEEGEDPEELDIEGVSYEAGEGTVYIECKTSNNAELEVRYGTDKTLRYKVETDDSEKRHRVEIRGLSPATRYYFRIKAKDSYDQVDRSKIYEFETKALRYDSIARRPSAEKDEAPDIDETDVVREDFSDDAIDGGDPANEKNENDKVPGGPIGKETSWQDDASGASTNGVFGFFRRIISWIREIF